MKPFLRHQGRLILKGLVLSPAALVAFRVRVLGEVQGQDLAEHAVVVLQRRGKLAGSRSLPVPGTPGADLHFSHPTGLPSPTTNTSQGSRHLALGLRAEKAHSVPMGKNQDTSGRWPVVVLPRDRCL